MCVTPEVIVSWGRSDASSQAMACTAWGRGAGSGAGGGPGPRRAQRAALIPIEANSAA
jgi:hypothetical protein